MANRKIRLEDVLNTVVENRQAHIKISIPGKIIEYDSAEQKATVLPVIKGKIVDPETGELESYDPEPIPNCPVIWPSGQWDGVEYAITFPLAPGDKVTLVFVHRSTDEWLTQGNDDSDPEDPRRFDYTDALVYPGGRAFSDALSADAVDDAAMVIKSGTQINRADDEFRVETQQTTNESSTQIWMETPHTVVDCNNIQLGGSAAFKPVALSPDVQQWLMNFILTVFNTHTHMDPLTGTTGPPVIPGTPPSITEFDSSTTTAI